MPAMTEMEIKNLVEEQGVKFIRLQFTDIFGVLKNVAIPIDQLDKALYGDLMFDGSSIEGFVRIEESDMYLKPDLSTFVVFPWRPKDGTVARMICDIYNSDNTPFEGDPRYVLRKVTREAQELGYTLNAGPEAEFFLFHVDADGRPTTITHDRASYFDLSPIDLGEDARRDMVLNLKKMGFDIEASHHEVAPGQHEILFKYTNALDIADKLSTFKFVVRTIAQRHGLHATFMPKPIFGINGSGLHINMSLEKDGVNAFYDPGVPDQLSEVALYFIGGVLKHARALTAVTNPTVNSYKRLVAGHEAPVNIAWAFRNRSPLIRIPAKKGESTRVELRSPDPSCNPYLALAVCLKAGLDGIKSRIMPPPPLQQNVYNLSEEELKRLGVGLLPISLDEALDELEQDEVIKDALGEHIFDRFMEAKRIECYNYRIQVYPWELEQYLTRF